MLRSPRLPNLHEKQMGGRPRWEGETDRRKGTLGLFLGNSRAGIPEVIPSLHIKNFGYFWSVCPLAGNQTLAQLWSRQEINHTTSQCRKTYRKVRNKAPPRIIAPPLINAQCKIKYHIKCPSRISAQSHTQFQNQRFKSFKSTKEGL